MKKALLILSVHFLVPVMLYAQTPSLADVARQERERQKNLTSKVIFTNESLGIAPSKAAAPPADKTAPADNSASLTAASHDEAWWRDAFKTARNEVKRTEDRAKVLQLELNQLNRDLLTRSDIYNREGVLTPQITAKNLDLAAAEKAAEYARNKVTQLEEDLRHAGAPAGWSR